MKIINFLVFCITCLPVLAQQKSAPTFKSTLTHSTIYYLSGAELTHAAKVPLVAGMQEVVLTNVATNLDVNTIQVSIPENVVLLSFRHQTSVTKEPVKDDPIRQRQQDSVQQLQAIVARLQNDYSINEDVLNRTTKLVENNFGNNKKEIASDDLIKLIQYYADKITSLKQSLFVIQVKRDSLYKHIGEIQVRMNKETIANNTLVGQMILQVMAQSATNADVTLSYFTRNAGWIPAYDVRVKSIDNSLKLVYKASVTQSTGLDWKDTKLSLSTSLPNQAAVVPVINPMYLQLYVPALYDAVTLSGAQSMMEMSDAKLEEVVKTGYNRKQKSAEVTSSVATYTTLSENQLNVNFNIDLPYDIPSDGKAYSVAIKEEMLQPSFRHYAIPKLDNDAFLVAELTNWQSLDLMPGQANIIMDNVYIGKSSIDPAAIEDTMNLSLGRDKRITIKRELVKDFTSTKTRGDSKTEISTYEVTVRNNKKQPVTITLKDQYPVSNQKEIEVTLIEKGTAEVNTESGIITWKETLAPGETKKLRFGYSVKYPKDKRLQPTR